MITARHVFQKNMTFRTTHSLFTTTNYVPVVSETDHGTWRRLELLKFPHTFRKPGEPLQSDSDRVGDPTLKARIEHNTDGQHDAMVTCRRGRNPLVRRPCDVAATDREDQDRHSGMAGRRRSYSRVLG